MNKKPILLIAFKRPDCTAQVLSAISEYKPNSLYFAVDGARSDVAGEEELCQQVRSLKNQVDWECKVFTRFSGENQGMRNGVINAINWFFEQVEDGIILEDDVLPNSDFFRFCEQMLEYYKYDTRIMHVSGCNLMFGKKFDGATYYFSRLTNIWGWATWRRSWKLYDPDLTDYQEFKKSKRYGDILIGDKNKWIYRKLMDFVERKQSTWDYQWQWTVLVNHGLTTVPQVSLITNIGYGNGATTASDAKTKLANIKSELLGGEILHPKFVLPNRQADYIFNSTTLHQIPLPKRIFKKVLKTLKIGK